MKCTRGSISVTTLALLFPVLAACGGNASADAASPPSDAVATAQTVAEASAAASPGGPVAETQTASLTWPKGTVEFPLNVCASQGPNTIQGGGSTAEWNLQFDANLLEAGDEGTLIVSETKQGMAVAYDATITSLTVNPDGTFTGAGQDASQAPFTISGTCTVSW